MGDDLLGDDLRQPQLQAGTLEFQPGRDGWPPDDGFRRQQLRRRLR